jgi:Tfp pilus assembly protein PilN
MIKINLLPPDKRKQGFPVNKVLLIISYFILGATLLIWAVSLAMFKYTEAKVGKVQADLSKMTVWQQRYDLNQAQNLDITKRGKLVSDLSKQRIVWSELLGNLGNVTPYGCWLTKVTQDGKKPENVTVEGSAMKLDQVLSFVHNLQLDPQVTSVVLDNTDQKKLNNVSVVNFKITITKRVAAQDAKKSKP